MPEQNITLAGQESLRFVLPRLLGDPRIVVLGRRCGTRAQVGLRIVLELGEPRYTMRTGTIDQRSAVGRDVLEGDPAPEQKSSRLNVEHRHVLVQGLLASTGERDTRRGCCAV